MARLLVRVSLTTGIPYRHLADLPDEILSIYLDEIGKGTDDGE